MLWPSNPLETSADKVISAIRTGITVESIATPRAMLKTREMARWKSIESDPELQAFDRVPVTEGAEIVGVCERAPNRVLPLSERMLLSSDASLLGFVEKANEQEFGFLVREGQITGLVTLSDIQKLPVYCVLYSLLMAVEMLLMQWIRKVCQDEPDKWLKYLDAEGQWQIEKNWKVAQRQNVALDRLSCADLWHKLTAAEGLGLFLPNPNQSHVFHGLRQLRNRVSHGSGIAVTPQLARKIPVRVQEAIRAHAFLENALKDLPV